jgi:hypothetical protein
MTDKSERLSRLDEEQIAARAYQLWVRRGCPIGSAEEDWFTARQELESSRNEAMAATPVPGPEGAVLHG